MNSLRPSVIALAAALLLTGCAQLPADAPLTLTVLHTNDTHAYAAGIDRRDRACLDDAACTGGYARLAEVIAARKAANDNVLALDAGDVWPGTLFYKAGGPKTITGLTNRIPWDAVTIGNHEFDGGCEEVLDYVRARSVPVLGANLEASSSCPLAEAGVVRPWIIRKIQGVPVGIIGMMNDEVVTISGACEETRFLDRRRALQTAANELRGRGVRHVIALTHLGYPSDMKLAASVTGIDIIVGGHTHDYLGPEPKAAGPYPTVVRAPDGAPVLIVTAWRSTAYLGELTVTFDRDGRAVSWKGAPVKLEASMPGDPGMRAELLPLRDKIEAFKKKTVAVNHHRFPDGIDLCREGDCLSGMLAVDAMLEWGRTFGADIAVLNGGAVRESLPEGTVTHSDLMDIMPFGNRIVVREVGGKAIREALEHGVSDDDVIGPRLLQCAGLHYRISRSAPLGSRISDVYVRLDGVWTPLDDRRSYRVVMNSYMASGGDGFKMFKSAPSASEEDESDLDLFESHLEKLGDIPMPENPRILWN
ncbi:MAG: bifunctional metallophosphatase/5'-nucleotidase [Sutterella sp.]|nr:bifunctional metallophosphatase/5'-nucleotidase [Sutterella sp.]